MISMYLQSREACGFCPSSLLPAMGLGWITVTALMLLIIEKGNSQSPGQTGYILIQCTTLNVEKDKELL